LNQANKPPITSHSVTPPSLEWRASSSTMSRDQFYCFSYELWASNIYIYIYIYIIWVIWCDCNNYASSQLGYLLLVIVCYNSQGTVRLMTNDFIGSIVKSWSLTGVLNWNRLVLFIGHMQESINWSLLMWAPLLFLSSSLTLYLSLYRWHAAACSSLLNCFHCVISCTTDETTLSYVLLDNTQHKTTLLHTMVGRLIQWND